MKRILIIVPSLGSFGGVETLSKNLAIVLGRSSEVYVVSILDVKKNSDVIKLLAHIDVYLNDGINRIIVESIKIFDLKTFSIFEINNDEKNRRGKESENIQKSNLNKSVLEISLVTKDKIIKCNGV